MGEFLSFMGESSVFMGELLALMGESSVFMGELRIQQFF
jgi:hypothetical protein